MWDIMEMNTAPHSQNFLPASLVGHEKVKPIGSRLQNAEIDVALRTYALNPKGVGYSINVLQSGKVKHLVEVGRCMAEVDTCRIRCWWTQSTQQAHR